MIFVTPDGITIDVKALQPENAESATISEPSEIVMDVILPTEGKIPADK